MIREFMRQSSDGTDRITGKSKAALFLNTKETKQGPPFAGWILCPV